MLINGDEVPIAVLPRVVGPEVCDAVLDLVDQTALVPGQTATHDDARDNRVGFLGHDHWTAGLLYELACRANVAVRWHLALTASESPQVAVYAAGERYDWHVDALSHGDKVRKLTVVLQLDAPDDYVGGDLQLSRFGAPTPAPLTLPVELRERGTVAVFPSYQLHRVTPVTAGARRALIGWILGPRYL